MARRIPLPTVTITIRLPVVLREKVDDARVAAGYTLSGYIRRALEESLLPPRGKGLSTQMFWDRAFSDCARTGHRTPNQCAEFADAAVEQRQGREPQ